MRGSLEFFRPCKVSSGPKCLRIPGLQYFSVSLVGHTDSWTSFCWIPYFDHIIWIWFGHYIFILVLFEHIFMSPHFCPPPPPPFFLSHLSGTVCTCMDACMCVFFCSWCMLTLWFRRRRPLQAQTNSPLSLKAMILVQKAHRKQAGPAGKANKIN